MGGMADGIGERRFAFTAGLGAGLLAAAVVADFVFRGFWNKHGLLTSLLASLLVVAVTVAVLNELLERRDRKRWSLVAQSALFALIQGARLTWTAMVEVLELAEVQSGTVESLDENARIALDRERVSGATTQLLAEPERRQVLQTRVKRLSDHASGVIANWASVLVGAAPYAKMLDRHVELQGRLEWLSSVLAHNEPVPDLSGRSRRMTRANVASEQAELFDDDWVHGMVVSITVLAAQLDRESREFAFSLAPGEWWEQRTRSLIES
jgi:hypothetical protein